MIIKPFLSRLVLINKLADAFILCQYEDDEGDKVLLTTDGDLANAVSGARAAGLKVRMTVYSYVFAE